MGRYSRTLRVKILKSVFLTVALPFFLILLGFYVAWNMYVRQRIVRDVATSTALMAGRIGSDLRAYDAALGRLREDAGVIEACGGTAGRANLSPAMAEIYGLLKDRRVKAVVSGLKADGRLAFGTMGRPVDGETGAGEADWGLFGLMAQAPGQVVGYQRTLRYGKLVQTDWSLGTAVTGPGGAAAGYLVADLSFGTSQDLSSGGGKGVTGRFLLANEFDRVIAAYDGSAISPFDRFSIPGRDGETVLEGTRYAFAHREVGLHGLSVYGLSSIEFIISSFRFGLYTIAVILVLFSAVFAFVLSRSVRRMTRPMNDILATMGRVSQGDFSARLDVISGDEFEEIAVSLNALIVEMESTVRRLLEGIELAKSAEMKQLQAQFNPHFLYNTIDTAKWMMRMGETEKASKVLTNMAKLLRYSVHDRQQDSMIALREDLVAIRTYLEIHLLSLGDRLAVDYDIDESVLGCRIPKLLIQPLVENALVHGIGSVGEGRLGISIKGVGDKVVITVTDTGKGFAVSQEDMVRAGLPGGDSGSALGMGLVLRRARLQYGDAFSFEVRSAAGEGSTVILSIPGKTGEDPCTE